MRSLLLFFNSLLFSFVCLASVPKISIITSLYKGEEYIKGFMEDIIRQTAFDQCELIIINANSPENEEAVINDYLDEYPNILYFRLDEDPGLYSVWNMAIEIAQGEYLTNANVDDRRSACCYEVYMKALDEHPDIDLVYSDLLVTHNPNETFEKNSAKSVKRRRKFAKKEMYDCLPGCSPMWRKTFHEKYGLFDESFRASGDWEMWCRAVAAGAQFLKVPGIYCLYYLSPRGLSTSNSFAWGETREVQRRYHYLWQ